MSLERHFSRWLWAIIALGVLMSLALALLTDGERFDMQSIRLVSEALQQAPLHVYDLVAEKNRYPYPPGFLPWAYASGRLGGDEVVDFEFFIRVAPIAATAGIAWLVQDFLGQRGSGSSARLAAAALVSLGPSFLLIAGHHGQIDAVAILPAVAALRRWELGPERSRALTAGLLIGLGAAVKTVPVLLLVALLPSARSRREVVTLLGAAAVPVALAFLPFALAGTLPSLERLSYRGLPGVGGLSLVVQPEIAGAWLGTSQERFSSLSLTLSSNSGLVTAAGLALVCAIGLIARPPATKMAVLLWLAVYVFGVNFFFQYVVWGLPFFLMAGHLRAVLAAEVVLLGPALVSYLRPWSQDLVTAAYSSVMVIVWLGCVVALVVTVRTSMRARRPREAVP